MHRRFRGLRWVTVAALVVPLLAVLPVTPANAVSGAVSTTDNPGVESPTGYTGKACLNGQGVNCNIYLDKRDVWLSGLPVSAALGAGTYFFAVLSPGGQPNPNDCAPLKANGDPANLSDTSPCETTNTGAGDTWQDRKFSVNGAGTITNLGTHTLDGNKLQVWPYDDTPNNGGVYILAVCAVPNSPTAPPGGPGVVPSDCKYDAFKVVENGGGGGGPEVCAPTITKSADGANDREFTWTLDKSASPTSVSKAAGTTATITYTVHANHDGGTIKNVNVTGTISVFNCNTNADGSTAPMTIDSVTDTLSNPVTNCTVSDATESDASTVSATLGGTLIDAQTDFAYSCDLGNTLPTGQVDNTATVNWSDQDITFNDSTKAPLPGGSASFTFEKIVFTETPTDNCVTVTDSFNGAVTGDPLGTVCVDPISATNLNPNGLANFNESHSYTSGSSGPGRFTFTYTRTINVTLGCVTYNNTASGVDNSTPHQDIANASASVTVCGRSGALTMGFWQNKNGQGIIVGSGTGTPKDCTALANWLEVYNPFKDLANFTGAPQCGTSPSLTGKTNTTPSGVAGYVYTTIKAAQCTSTSKTCNSMLKAQMLATALDVYFSDPALGGNKIGAFNGLGNSQPVIGNLNIDLTHICNMIDGSGGSATCSGTFSDASNVFGGTSCQTVSQLLAYSNADGSAFNNGNPVSNSGGSNWYLQNKPKQVLAKNTFDAINNDVATGC